MRTFTQVNERKQDAVRLPLFSDLQEGCVNPVDQTTVRPHVHSPHPVFTAGTAPAAPAEDTAAERGIIGMCQLRLRSSFSPPLFHEQGAFPLKEHQPQREV